MTTSEPRTDDVDGMDLLETFEVTPGMDERTRRRAVWTRLRAVIETRRTP